MIPDEDRCMKAYREIREVLRDVQNEEVRLVLLMLHVDLMDCMHEYSREPYMDDLPRAVRMAWESKSHH